MISIERENSEQVDLPRSIELFCHYVVDVCDVDYIE
jgi:hypothetical protein